MSEHAQDERRDEGCPPDEPMAAPAPADLATRPRYAVPRLTKHGSIADQTAATDFSSGAPPV